MSKLFCIVLLALATCGLCSSAELRRQNQVPEPLMGTRGVLDNVVSSLQEAATHAGQSVGSFTSGILEQVTEFRENLTADVQRVQESIQQAVANVSSQLADVGSDVDECILARRRGADAALNEAVYNVTTCAENSLARITGLVSELINVTRAAADAASEVNLQAIDCKSENSNIFSVGTCLAGLLWQAEVKAATITGQSAILMARINLSLGALPATLNICAASKLAKAALAVGQLDIALGQCALSAVTGGD